MLQCCNAGGCCAAGTAAMQPKHWAEHGRDAALTPLLFPAAISCCTPGVCLQLVVQITLLVFQAVLEVSSLLQLLAFVLLLFMSRFQAVLQKHQVTSAAWKSLVCHWPQDVLCTPRCVKVRGNRNPCSLLQKRKRGKEGEDDVYFWLVAPLMLHRAKHNNFSMFATLLLLWCELLLLLNSQIPRSPSSLHNSLHNLTLHFLGQPLSPVWAITYLQVFIVLLVLLVSLHTASQFLWVLWL